MQANNITGTITLALVEESVNYFYMYLTCISAQMSKATMHYDWMPGKIHPELRRGTYREPNHNLDCLFLSYSSVP